MRNAGLNWHFGKSGFDEESASLAYDKLRITSLELAVEYCAYLSEEKLNFEINNFNENQIVITADTVVFNKKLLEKPQSEAEVYEMIRGLNGKEHYVITAVSISSADFIKTPLPRISRNSNEIFTFGKNTFVAITTVNLNGVTNELIKKMIETESPYTCSGGYTIDGILNPYFSVLKGSEENVVGLPLCEILEILNTDSIGI